MKTPYWFSAGQAADTGASTICRTAKQMSAGALMIHITASAPAPGLNVGISGKP